MYAAQSAIRTRSGSALKLQIPGYFPDLFASRPSSIRLCERDGRFVGSGRRQGMPTHGVHESGLLFGIPWVAPSHHLWGEHRIERLKVGPALGYRSA